MDDLHVEMKLCISFFYFLFLGIFPVSVGSLFKDVSSSECLVSIDGIIIEKLYYRVICLESLRENHEKSVSLASLLVEFWTLDFWDTKQAY